MSDNRYAPPAAHVKDVLPAQTAKTRPREIVLAVQLAGMNYFLGIAALVLQWDYYVSLRPPVVLIFSQVLSLLVLVWIYSRIYVGRNWARILLLALTVLAVLFLFIGPALEAVKASPLLVQIQVVVRYGATFAILWLLFLSPGREWFSKPRHG